MMKNIRNMLMVSVAIVGIIPSSLTAKISADELAGIIRTTRSCPVQPIENTRPEPKSWFSSFRAKVGNGLRCMGDHIRSEGNKRTPAGRMKEWVKEVSAKFASSRLGIKLDAGIFNPIGNALRKVGQWIKGGKETQTHVRTTLNAVGLKYRAQEHEVNEALRVVATAAYNVGGNASEYYSNVVQGMNKRGHIAQDANAVYLEAVSTAIVQARPEVSMEDFALEMLKVSLKEIASHESLKGSQRKADAVGKFLERAYKTSKAKQKVQTSLAAPAA